MNRPEYKRILLTRTDRLGDVLLTTPAIKAVRDAYPNAYIAMVVRPYTELALKGNPHLNEVIVYDKYGAYRSTAGSLKFAKSLRDNRFDLVIIFHPTNRMHILSFLAGIPKRVGYDERFSFLLTDRIKNLKHEGKKHESEYNFDLLDVLGVESSENKLYLTVDGEAQKSVNLLLSKYGVKDNDKIISLHPGASCLSKMWPADKFAQLADKLIDKYNVKIVVTGASEKKDMDSCESVKKLMQKEALYFVGNLNIIELGALLQRSALFISNDSGPVHIAVAVNTPVISLFGRNQAGLGPKRWGPLGPKDISLHKDVGCAGLCLAHDCIRKFECLEAISVDEVLDAAEKLSNIGKQ
ncbi:glycosyltransferase family 9 protein [Candidatus Omnitrophota bacterium]